MSGYRNSKLPQKKTKGRRVPNNQDSENRVIALAACAVGVVTSAILAATAKSVFGVVLWLIICAAAIIGLVSLSAGYFSILQDMYKPKKPEKKAKPREYTEYDQRSYQPRREDVRARPQPRRKPIIDIPLDDEPLQSGTPAQRPTEYARTSPQGVSQLYAPPLQEEKPASNQPAATVAQGTPSAVQTEYSTQPTPVTIQSATVATPSPAPAQTKPVYEHSTYSQPQQAAESSYKITPPKHNPDVWKKSNTNIVVWPGGRVEPASKYVFNFETAEIEEPKAPELKETAAEEYVETKQVEPAFDFETAEVETRDAESNEDVSKEAAEPQIDNDDVSVDASDAENTPSAETKSIEIAGELQHIEDESEEPRESDTTNDAPSSSDKQNDAASLEALQQWPADQDETTGSDAASKSALQLENSTIVNDNGQEELILPDTSQDIGITQEATGAEQEKGTEPNDEEGKPQDNNIDASLSADVSEEATPNEPASEPVEADQQAQNGIVEEAEEEASVEAQVLTIESEDEENPDTGKTVSAEAYGGQGADSSAPDVIHLPAQLELWGGEPAEAVNRSDVVESTPEHESAAQEHEAQPKDAEEPAGSTKPVRNDVEPTLFLPARNVVLLSEHSILGDDAVEADRDSSDSSEPAESVATELTDVIFLPASLTDWKTAESAAKEESETDSAPDVIYLPASLMSDETSESAAEEVADIESEEETVSEDIDPQATYVFPPIDLLNPPVMRNEEAAAEELQENAERLAATLTSFGVDAVAGDAVRGPAVTRYEFTLGAGVKLSKITNLQDDIALALGAVGVRIAPIPDKQSVVGIEVPNRTVTPVSIRTLLESDEFRKQKSPTAFAVGEDISGARIIGEVSQFPHVLVAGTTGSGKSVCTNSLIISLLYKSKPEDVRFIMVDPKMVELAPYNGIPHLLIPVVTDPKKAAGALQWAVYEMMKRYQAFSEKGVKDLVSYNALVKDDPSTQKLPTIVVVIDELADLMLIAAKEVEESICRVAQMGRAAGMHLIIATQSPRADVITGLMKANIPSRIAFAVASSLESRIILDTVGAEKLVGKGDMLYAPIGQGKPQRVQGCFISAEEIDRVVEFLKANGQASYDASVMERIEQNVSNGKDGGADESQDELTEESSSSEDDALLEEAVEVLLETGQASTSMLQRRLKLGYSRAARIIDMLEERGIVGPFEGSKPRKILITREAWKRRKDAPMEDIPS